MGSNLKKVVHALEKKDEVRGSHVEMIVLYSVSFKYNQACYLTCPNWLICLKGVSKAIMENAGPEVEKECDDLGKEQCF